MPKSVLISGASSGIGKALSLELDRQGYFVFAGVRSPMDADTLCSQASSQLTPVMLDVTLPEMINTTCEEVSDKTGGELFCLVNNAGISISGAMEFMPLQEFRHQIEVNLVGQLALTQACLPMLRKGMGRVVFISSTAGRMVTPFNGPYGTSKAALVAMADALRMELAPWRIPVSVMILGSIQTPIWEKSALIASQILRRLPAGAWELYGKSQKRAGAFYSQIGRSGMRVEKMVKITQQLIEKAHPRAYVLVGWDAVLLELMSKLLPVRLRDWLVRRQMGLLKL
jgi:NAD(P)-dependent dehydrogenase (short-subunit alcohol dehydrogenase family)